MDTLTYPFFFAKWSPYTLLSFPSLRLPWHNRSHPSTHQTPSIQTIARLFVSTLHFEVTINLSISDRFRCCNGFFDAPELLLYAIRFRAHANLLLKTGRIRSTAKKLFFTEGRKVFFWEKKRDSSREKSTVIVGSSENWDKFWIGNLFFLVEDLLYG